MQNHHSNRSTDRSNKAEAIPRSLRENRTGYAFIVAGGLLLASTIVPIGLKTVTSWAWVSGLVLVGGGVLAEVVGLLGLYQGFDTQNTHLPGLGVLSGIVAGVSALAVIAMAVIALVAEGALGMNLGKPLGLFVIVTLSMAGGLSLGLLSTGTAGLRTGAFSQTTSLLLIVGGTSLLVPVVAEILRRGVGIAIGIPPEIVFPAIGLFILDSLAIGYSVLSGR